MKELFHKLSKMNIFNKSFVNVLMVFIVTFVS